MVFVELVGILHTHIRLITLDADIVVDNAPVAGRAQAQSGTVVQIAVQVAYIGSDRQVGQYAESQSGKHLMQSPFAVEQIGGRHLLVARYGRRATEIVAYIGVRQQSHGKSQPRNQAELHDHVVERRIFSVGLVAVFLEVRSCQGQSCVEHERQRVDSRIGGRIQGIDVAVRTQAISHTAHGSIVDESLVGQLAQSIPRIRRVSTVLGIGSQ